MFDCNCRYMVSSEKELAPFATKDEVEQTKDYALPSIYPIKFNIALDETNVYDWDYRYRKIPAYSAKSKFSFSFRGREKWVLAHP